MSKLVVDVRLPLADFTLDVAFTAVSAVIGVFGPSGAGKSSLLETVAGLRRGARGRISLGDEIWLDTPAGLDLPPERRGVGYVPQEGLLFPHLGVRGNLLSGARRVPDPAAGLARVVELLELSPLLERSISALSGGERQRVALGRALCSAPQLLLLDEPLAALDLARRRRLLVLLRRLRDELTVPMVFISHDPIEVQALCDEVVVLERGRHLTSGAPATVFSDPQVLPLADRPGYANVLPARVTASSDGATGLSLDPSGPGVMAGATGLAPGDAVLLELAGDRILIATEAPRGLSARNALAAKIARIQGAGDLTLVHAVLDPGGQTLVVEVTATTPDRLGLAPGQPVHLVVKATSCRVHAETAPRPGLSARAQAALGTG